MEVKSDAKEQYCIGTWNVRSMNQSKLEVVKQEMAGPSLSGVLNVHASPKTMNFPLTGLSQGQ